MKKQLFYIIFVLTPVFCFAQKKSSIIDYPISEIPDSLLENANSVIRSANFEMLVHNETKIVFSKKAVITILNKNSNHKSLQVYYNNFRKIKSIKVAIYDRDGHRIKAAGKKDILDFSLTDEGTIADDGRLKEVNLIHMQYPYTLVYEYEVEVTESYFMPDWRPVPGYNTSVQSSSCQIVSLANQNILFKENLMTKKMKETSDGGKHIRSWEISNFKAIEKEPLGQNFSDLAPSVYLANELLSLGDVVGKGDTWESFSKFFYTLNENHNDISDELKEEIKRITKTANSDKEKINILYSFLKENTRYVSIQLGVGGWRSFKGSFVEKNKYGDCKALTYFMKSLLEEIDIIAYPALIERGYKPNSIEDDFVSDVFNHVILYIPDEDIWLECTSSTSYLGLVESDIAGRKALLVKETGGKIVEMPSIEKSDIEIKNILEISDSEATKISSKIILKGKAHEWFRYVEKHFTQERQLKTFENLLKCPIKTNTLKFEIKPEATLPQVNVEMTYEPVNLMSKSSKRIFLPIKSNIDYYSKNFPHLENRKQTISMQNEKELKEITTVIIPEGYQLESLPEEVNITSDFGSFSISFIEKPGKIEVFKKGGFKKGEFPAENYSKLVGFHNAIKATNNLNIVFAIKK